MSVIEKNLDFGTHRAVPITETLLKVLSLAPKFGITRVANVTGLDFIGIPVYVVCRPNSKSLSVFQGKGISKEAAQVSGIMESIECYHSENPNIPIYNASIQSIVKYGNPIDITKLAKLNSKNFTDESIIHWCFGQDLLNNCIEKLVPYSCVHNDYTTINNTDNDGFFISDTNGLASGNIKDEAINHALFEVIERDALALWSLCVPHYKASKKVNLETINISFIQNTISKIHKAGIHIGVWDITSDIGIPTFMCKLLPSEDELQTGMRPAYGSGTHLSPEIAILRAITEAAQSRLTFISGARDDQYCSIYQNQTKPEVYARWKQEIEEESKQSFSEVNYNFVQKDLSYCQNLILEKLSSVGIKEVICVDLTKPEYNIPVVKIIVPGLEGISYSGQRILGQRGGEAYLKRQQGLI